MFTYRQWQGLWKQVGCRIVVLFVFCFLLFSFLFAAFTAFLFPNNCSTDSRRRDRFAHADRGRRVCLSVALIAAAACAAAGALSAVIMHELFYIGCTFHFGLCECFPDRLYGAQMYVL